MNLQLFFSHSERLLALKKTRVDFAVRVLLGQALEARGINPHANYLTTLVDVSSAKVHSSETLFDVALGCAKSLGHAGSASSGSMVQPISAQTDGRVNRRNGAGPNSAEMRHSTGPVQP